MRHLTGLTKKTGFLQEAVGPIHRGTASLTLSQMFSGVPKHSSKSAANLEARLLPLAHCNQIYQNPICPNSFMSCSVAIEPWGVDVKVGQRQGFVQFSGFQVCVL